MPIPNLVPSYGTVDIQNTTFSIDALGRYICNTWQEATENSGPEFDAVVIGSGMYGAYCASKIYRLHTSKRVLVLDAGSFLVSEHIQNLTRMGLNVPSPIAPASDPGVAQDLVWGIPWRGNVDFPGLAYCIGGKSIYWGGWCPRLTSSDLANWPNDTASYLNSHYDDIEREIGVTPKTDFISGILFDVLKQRFVDVSASVLNIDLSIGNNGIEDAPLAVQGESPAPGLFSFDKYSSATVLIDSIREDAASSGGSDASRRLFLVPKAHVVKLHTNNGLVNSLEVSVDGQRRFLPIPSNCNVILAASTIETTRLALASFPTSLMGRNLMAHVRSDFTVRVRRSSLPPLPTDVETAALLVRGSSTTGGRFHLQITASANTTNSDALLFRMIPDLDYLQEQLANDDPEWITITIRGVGEMQGNRNATIPNTDSSWLNLSPFEFDELGCHAPMLTLKLVIKIYALGRIWIKPRLISLKRLLVMRRIFSIYTMAVGKPLHFL